MKDTSKSYLLLSPSYHFQHVFWWDIWSPLCSNFIMFWLGANIWLTTQLIFLIFQLSFLVFSITFQTWLGVPHSSIASIFRCVCTHLIDSIGIHFHFLCCTHGNKFIGTHDVVHNTFVAIVQDVGFDVRWKQLHALFSTMFNFFRWWINTVLIKDDIRTLANVIILTQCEKTYFPNIEQLKVCYFWCHSSLKKELLQLTFH